MTTENIDQVPSVSDLRSELLLRRLGGGRTGRRSGLPRADRDRPLRLSSGQQQMWFLNRLDPDSREFLVPLAFRVRGVADRDAVERALSALIARHEILRTRYVLTGDEPEQVIDAPAPIQVATDVLTGSADEREARCAQVLAAEAARPFDLERDWPIRARLVALEADDHVLAVIFHHVAFDAWSAQVFVREFAQLYRAFVEHAVPDLPDLPVQFADFAAAQHTADAERETARHLGYWREQLAELPTIDLPADRQRPAVREHDGAAVEFALPTALAGQVRQLAERLGTTPFVVFLAAFQLLVSRYTGLTDVPVGTVVSGRSRPELQGLIGYGINNLVMRTRWHERQSFAELVAAAREVLADAYDHQNVSFARLVDELQPERDMSRSPLYQVALTMHEPRRDAVTLPGARMWPYPLTGGIAKCDLELQVGDAGDGRLGGHLVYATALFDESTVERMATHLRNLLAAAVADVDAPLASLDLLDAAERAVVIGAPRSAAPVQSCLHELFEERVRRSPDAVAVVVGGVSLSYGEL
ncbi:condensation domain-containing protein, partial [Micromonospora sp. NPDC051141]|uniref:condensation domain-containing protein n=1 Tax=Micromonospora sp. NPDC051141 TaxID=3364284 RepID=UPI0037A9F561